MAERIAYVQKSYKSAAAIGGAMAAQVPAM
jgi:hypothetical protein